MTLLKSSAMRRRAKAAGLQLSPEALEVLDRKVDRILEDAEVATKACGHHRITAPIMRRIIEP